MSKATNSKKKKKASGDEKKKHINIKALFAYLNVKVFIKGNDFQKLSNTIFRRDKNCETTSNKKIELYVVKLFVINISNIKIIYKIVNVNIY